MVLALEPHSACVSGTHKAQCVMFPSLAIHHIPLLESGNDLWVTLSTCYLSSQGVTPQHRCQARLKMEQGSLEAEASTRCTSCFFCLRGQEENWWHKLCKLFSRNAQGCPEELSFLWPLTERHIGSSVGDEECG